MKEELLYLEERIAALDRRLDDSIAQAYRALDKAENNMNIRLDHMNEFRAQILSERGGFVSREAWEERNNVVNHSLKTLDDFVANLTGRIWALGVGAAGISVAVGLAIKYL